MKSRNREPHLPLKQRLTSFDEVALGYDLPTAQAEASRCLDCKHAPCINGCPVNINIPKFIKELLNNDIDQAYHTITLDNPLPSICGRVCPQENQCEKVCTLGLKFESVAIGTLERFVADHSHRSTPQHVSSNTKVAIVGSGPSGLACAAQLLNAGINVEMFEALHAVGGVLRYGIPEFRLPNHIIDDEIKRLTDQGLVIHFNTIVGTSITFDQLKAQGFKAIYVATGAGTPYFLNVPGENAPNVLSANEFLTRINLMKAYDSTYLTPLITGKNIVVIGGGNVALDAARAAKRLTDGQVTILYRRTREAMPARKAELHAADDEQINFEYLAAPKAFVLTNNCVSSIICERNELIPTEQGRPKVRAIPGQTFEVPTDLVIIAIGSRPNQTLRNAFASQHWNERGYLITDEHQVDQAIYAGGDIIENEGTVIHAIRDGKLAANKIINYLKSL